MRKFKLTKDTLAEMCARAGMLPEVRHAYKGYDIFIGHGFTPRPGRDFRKFGIEESAFPFGAYATVWSVAKGEDHILVANVNPYKNPQERGLRLIEAMTEAKRFIDKLKAEQGLHVYH